MTGWPVPRWWAEAAGPSGGWHDARVLDAPLRRRYAPALGRLADRLSRGGLRAGHVTAVGLAVGLAACVAAGLGLWGAALALWLANRALDGLDGALARIEGPTDLGGLLDFTADFVVYGGFVLGVAVAVPDAQLAICFLLAAYLLNNVVLLSLASLIEKRRLAAGDERSLRFTPALTEGTETIAAYVLLCLVPGRAAVVAWAFGALVLVSVAQRLVLARRLLATSTSDG
jgi:phosphatidylglycerophosphate synthase